MVFLLEVPSCEQGDLHPCYNFRQHEVQTKSRPWQAQMPCKPLTKYLLEVHTLLQGWPPRICTVEFECRRWNDDDPNKRSQDPQSLLEDLDTRQVLGSEETYALKKSSTYSTLLYISLTILLFQEALIQKIEGEEANFPFILIALISYKWNIQTFNFM